MPTFFPTLTISSSLKPPSSIAMQPFSVSEELGECSLCRSPICLRFRQTTTAIIAYRRAKYILVVREIINIREISLLWPHSFCNMYRRYCFQCDCEYTQSGTHHTPFSYRAGGREIKDEGYIWRCMK